MNKRGGRVASSCGLSLALLLPPIRAVLAAPVPMLRVTGAVAQPADWNVVRLRQTFSASIQPIRYTLKGKTHTAHVLPLLALLDQAHPRLNPHIKNHQLQFVVEVQGRDGYTADFTLAELLPAVGHRRVWIALDEDDQPLGEEGGPVGLLSPDDQKPGRWVHSVAIITVVDMAQLGTASKPSP